MRPTTKLGKHVEDPISGDCWDKISSLPDELLGHILSFLPTKGAVSTSILSTRWRYLFTLTSCLSFDDAPCFGHVEQNERIEATRRFKDFVDKTLEVHQISPIKKFSLLCRDSQDNSDLNRWLSIALQKGVQELHYELPDRIHFVPDGFFSCETLLKLKMIGHGYNNLEIPLSAWLPKLKILHLDRITFIDFDSMERLFSCIELLEELTLKACDYDADEDRVIYRSETLKVLTIEHCTFLFCTFEIDAPNLAYLSYSSNNGVKFVPSWKSSGSFIKAKLSFNCSFHDAFDTNDNSVEYEREFLKAIAYKATELRFEMNSIELLLTLDDDEQMSDFNDLTRLELDNFPYKKWVYVTSLLDRSPQLETIIFKTGFRRCSCSRFCYSEEDIDCYCDLPTFSNIPLNPFSCQAQLIEVHDFSAHKGSLSLIGHLLRNASVLKRLILYRHEDDDSDLNISQELLMLPRASKDCCLEMKPTPSAMLN